MHSQAGFLFSFSKKEIKSCLPTGPLTTAGEAGNELAKEVLFANINCTFFQSRILKLPESYHTEHQRGEFD